MKEWAKRVAYLKDKYWQDRKYKPLCPLDESRFPLNYQVPDSEIIYDFEVQSNIYTVTAFYRDLHKIIIWYHTDNLPLDEQAIKRKAYDINQTTLDNYPKELNENGNASITIDVKPITIPAFRSIFERPKRYVTGFNSNFYDLPVASYILAYIYNYNALPEASGLRNWNNLLISPVDTIENNLAYKKDLYHEGYKIQNRMPLYQIASLFDSPRKDTRRSFNPDKGTVPYIYQIYRRLMNTGLHLDMKLLNEKDSKDKNTSARYTSLKRISAQLGFQIEEPGEVDLSSNRPLTEQECINLAAYNASDVLVTTLIYQSKSYQNVLSTREGLLNRFDETNFFGRLNNNSTSAQYVEDVIAPRDSDKLIDDDEITCFYPVHGKEYDALQRQINIDFFGQEILDKNGKCVGYQGRTVPVVANDLKNNFYHYVYCSKVLQHVATDETDLYYKFKSSPALQNQFRVWCKQNFTPLMESNYQAWLNNPQNEELHDRDYLDQKWTKYLQTLPNFKPVQGLKRGKPATIQRYRVKYGEIQEDLLEHHRLKFKGLFPKEVYELYSYFRNAKATYEYQDGKKIIIKTAREQAVEDYVNHYIPILGYEPQSESDAKKGIKPKAKSPDNVYYKFRKDHSVSGIGIHAAIPGQPSWLSYSVGGVHGEVINLDKMKRDITNAKKFNKLLRTFKTRYKNPQDFIEEATSNQIPEIKQKYVGPKKQNKEFLSALKSFASVHKGKLTYKKYVNEKLDPKDYVIPIDMHYAVHVDVDSLYPSTMINMHLFSKWQTEYHDPKDFDKTNCIGHWKDVYAHLRAERVRLKKAANSVPADQWGPLQRHQWAIQLINKLLLNSASGIADGKWETKVRINNKIASMRIIGQLMLTYLVYEVAQKGVYSTSTNTDGVYLTSPDKNFSEKDIHYEIEHWKLRHHLGATPEIMYHFISKDSNNRFEQEKPDIFGNVAGGTIGNAEGASSGKKMTQPFVIDAGIINYFKTHKNICKTYNLPENDLMAYLKKQQNIILSAKEYTPEVRNAMLSFCWPVQPQKGQHFIMQKSNALGTDYLQIQHVNRLIIVKHGLKLVGYHIKKKGAKNTLDQSITDWCKTTGQISENDYQNHAYRVKITNMNPDWQFLRLNLDLSSYFANKTLWQDLDLNAYLKFTESRILGEPGKRIWVEETFPKPEYAEHMEYLTKEN